MIATLFAVSAACDLRRPSGVSTDDMTPDPRFGPYAASLPGGGRARLWPVQPTR